MFFRRPTRFGAAMREFKKQVDLAIWILLGLNGCVVAFAALSSPEPGGRRCETVGRLSRAKPIIFAAAGNAMGSRDGPSCVLPTLNLPASANA